MYKEIEHFIFEFYKIATTDLIIGYHFKKINDFNQHIPHIAKFWLYRLTQEKNDQGIKFNFIKAHQSLTLKKGEIDRWEMLFKNLLSGADFNQDFKDRWIRDVKLLKSVLIKAL